MGKVLGWAADTDPVADVLADADLLVGDPYAEDTVDLSTAETEADDLAETVAAWRRLARDHRHALQRAAWLGQRKYEAQLRATRIVDRDLGRWLAAPPAGCEIAATIRLTDDSD